MDTLGQNQNPVKGFSVEGDSNFRPARAELPGIWLKPTDYAPTEPEHRWWKEVRKLLPEKRQKQIWGCRKYASHIEKSTHRGAVDFVTPVGCIDRTACPFCAWHYAKSQATEVAHKLQAVCDAADTALLEITAEAVIPLWQQAMQTPWCDRAEERGRPCSPVNCRICEVALAEHARASAIETKIVRDFREFWSQRASTTGGYLTWRVSYENRQLRLVLHALIPYVGVEATVDRSLTPTVPNAEELQRGWTGIVTAQGGAGSLIATAHWELETIERVVRHAHTPTMEVIEREHGASPLTATDIRTAARAAGLATAIAGGKIRRQQRAIWFGALSARHHARTLRILNVLIELRDSEATTVIKDRYRIQRVEGHGVVVQSVWTGEEHVIDHAKWRGGAAIDPHGNPLGDLNDKLFWSVRTRPDYESEYLKFAAQLGGGGKRIRHINSQADLQSAQWNLWGTLMESTFKPAARW